MPNIHCKEMEVRLYKWFLRRRKQGKTVQTDWFRQKNQGLWTNGAYCVKPLMFYQRLGVGTIIPTPMIEYNSHVAVKFTATVYANCKNIMEWLNE